MIKHALEFSKKEKVLNYACQTYQLSRPNKVGTMIALIRKCSPKTLEEWQNYYFQNVKSKEHIEKLGKKLFVKITEVIQAEVLEITEKDCVDYMLQLVIDRTFDGYTTEIQTIYGQLQNYLDIKIEPAPYDAFDNQHNKVYYT